MSTENGEVIINTENIGFWDTLINNITSGSWWASETPSYIIFTLLVGFIVWCVEKFMEHERRKPFKGWKLKIIKNRKEIEAYNETSLYWRSVEEYKSSDVALWQFIKPLVKDNGDSEWVKCSHKEAIDDGWLKVSDKNDKNPSITIDLDLYINEFKDKYKSNKSGLPHPLDTADTSSKPNNASENTIN